MPAILDYFWRLLPANPILLRVVEAGGKRKRDLFIRCGYLALLIVVVLFALLTSTSSTGVMSLSALTTTSKQTFRAMSYLQLALVALLAPIFTAGAITQEKDSQTYDILLSTPLTNGQIVLGSLLSRLFFIIALLISGIPIFSVTQIFGGVAVSSIVMSFAIAAATAFVTGALAMAIATVKIGSRRTIFGFYLFIVLYLVGGFLLDRLDYFWIAGPRSSSAVAHISWLTAIHPFLALRVVLGDPTYRPPEVGMLPAALQGWPLSWYFTNPAGFFVTAMFTLSALLVIPSIVMLRRIAQSTLSLRGWLLTKLHLSRGDRTRKPRYVWANPIAWREAKTKASATRASLLRYAFIAFGVFAALALVMTFATFDAPPPKYITPDSFSPVSNTLFINGDSTFGVPDGFSAITLNGQPASAAALHGYYKVDTVMTKLARDKTRQLASIELSSIPRKLDENKTRQFLLGLIILEFAAVLLIVTNAAASTVTREKEDGSLDLLLTTPITSRYYIWGKLRGLVSFAIPLLAVPVLSALIFVTYDLGRLIRGGDPLFRWIIFPEAVLVLPITLLIVVAFAGILGMNLSLHFRTSVRAVMASIGIMLGACAGLGWCGLQLLNSRAEGGLTLALSALSPFTVVILMIDPWSFGGRSFADPNELAANRFTIAGMAIAAAGIYALGVWSMYKSMVKNFDMTIRRQSR